MVLGQWHYSPTFQIGRDVSKLVWQACFLSHDDKAGLIEKLNHHELGLREKTDILSYFKVSKSGLLYLWSLNRTFNLINFQNNTVLKTTHIIHSLLK